MVVEGPLVDLPHLFSLPFSTPSDPRVVCCSGITPTHNGRLWNLTPTHQTPFSRNHSKCPVLPRRTKANYFCMNDSGGISCFMMKPQMPAGSPTHKVPGAHSLAHRLHSVQIVRCPAPKELANSTHTTTTSSFTSLLLSSCLPPTLRHSNIHYFCLAD